MFVFVAIWQVMPGEVDPNDQVSLVTRLLYTLGAAVVLSPIAGAIGAAVTSYVDDQLTPIAGSERNLSSKFWHDYRPRSRRLLV